MCEGWWRAENVCNLGSSAKKGNRGNCGNKSRVETSKNIQIYRELRERSHRDSHVLMLMQFVILKAFARNVERCLALIKIPDDDCFYACSD